MIPQQKNSPKRMGRDETPAQLFSWVVMAQTHILSANILYEYYESRRRLGLTLAGHWLDASRNVIDMLYGMAIENLVKGFLVAKGNWPFIDKPSITRKCRIETLVHRLARGSNRRFNPLLEGHNLNRLFKNADIKRNPDDIELLELLTDIIVSGKYPIGRNAKIRPYVFPYLSKHSTYEEHQHIMRILKRVQTEMEEYLVSNQQWRRDSNLIDLNLGMDS